jgi:hypothetical protein
MSAPPVKRWYAFWKKTEADPVTNVEETKRVVDKPVATPSTSCWRSSKHSANSFPVGTTLTIGAEETLERAVVISGGNLYVVWKEGLKKETLMRVEDWLALAEGKQITVTAVPSLNLRNAQKV